MSGRASSGIFLSDQIPARSSNSSSGENKKAVVRAPINHTGNHGYMSPCAWRLSCFGASATPFLIAVMVIFHVPPLSSVSLAFVDSIPFFGRSVTTFIAAMPISGMPAM